MHKNNLKNLSRLIFCAATQNCHSKLNYFKDVIKIYWYKKNFQHELF